MPRWSAGRTHPLHHAPHAAARVPGAAVAPAPWAPSLSRAALRVAPSPASPPSSRAGDTYQVNYTFALEREGAGPIESGDLDAWLDALCTAHEAGYGARLDLGDFVVLSASPELFVERRGDRLTARPMKGTSPRGRWLEEDLARRDALVASEKARAENVMIVDLLRNDLGRIAATGSVRGAGAVHARSAIRRCGSSPRRSRPRCRRRRRAAGLGVVDLMRALFPCGSVTGAPKIRTMEIIAALEAEPRGVYTGAIGLVRPGGDAVFSVAIRTLVVDRGTGDGVARDRRRHRRRFARRRRVRRMPAEGRVRRRRADGRRAGGRSRVPPAAQRDFELIETVRVDSGAWQHLLDASRSHGRVGALLRLARGIGPRSSRRARRSRRRSA